VAWDPETDPNVAGYKVYYGTASRSYQYNNDAGKNTTSTVSNLQTGTTYYFAVTAYNATGIESGYSAEVPYAATTCQYTLSPTSQSIGASGGPASTGVSTQSGCPWTAVSNALPWLSIPSTGSGTGSGTVSYSVAANSATTSRSGTMTIGGQTFTVNQAGSVQYSLSISKSGTGTGTVSNSPTGTSFSAGTPVTLTAAPDANSTFSGWSGGGCSGTSPCTVTMNGNTSVTATFNLKTYTITASTGANGSISPQGTVTVNSGANQSFTVAPNSGYQIADVTVDGASVGAVASYLFGSVMANHTIVASFKLPATYTLSVAKSGTGTGTVSNSPTGTSFSAGTPVTLTAAPDANSTFSGWSGGGCSGTSPCTVTMNGNTSVTATFNLQTYTITASTVDSNGSISPQGAVTVNSGTSQTFTIKPNIGYQVSDVKVDGTSTGGVSSYTFGNVRSNHTIQPTFSPANSSPGTVVVAVNAGGTQYSNGTGITYAGDKYYSGGRTWRTTAAIAGTTDDLLYQSERYGNFSYSTRVANGNYTVTLKFAEIYWSNTGRRIFNVKIGGKQVISNLDIFAKVGKNQAYDVAIPVTVTNGILKIDFVTMVDNAKVSAILVQTR
jgi:hypothetical protein